MKQAANRVTQADRPVCLSEQQRARIRGHGPAIEASHNLAARHSSEIQRILATPVGIGDRSPFHVKVVAAQQPSLSWSPDVPIESEKSALGAWLRQPGDGSQVVWCPEKPPDRPSHGRELSFAHSVPSDIFGEIAALFRRCRPGFSQGSLQRCVFNPERIPGTSEGVDVSVQLARFVPRTQKCVASSLWLRQYRTDRSRLCRAYPSSKIHANARSPSNE